MLNGLASTAPAKLPSTVKVPEASSTSDSPYSHALLFGPMVPTMKESEKFWKPIALLGSEDPALPLTV